MSVGKYSPTVTHSYRCDQDWWHKNGGKIRTMSDGSYFGCDNDGYDQYGYDINGKDRAGYTEDEYLLSSKWQYNDNIKKDELVYTLFEQVYQDWKNINLLESKND